MLRLRGRALLQSKQQPCWHPCAGSGRFSLQFGLNLFFWSGERQVTGLSIACGDAAHTGGQPKLELRMQSRRAWNPFYVLCCRDMDLEHCGERHSQMRCEWHTATAGYVGFQ
jgi:hypothetical protein